MAELENKALSIQGRERPVKRRGFKDMFGQVIHEERQNGIEPSVGVPHAWSKEFLDEQGGKPVTLFSKLLVGLALGRTWMLMPTGNETALRGWILDQPEDSVTIPELFRMSYRLNGGDVYFTLLTIENVLARHWRYPNREGLPQTRRLLPIVSGHNYDQDRFGSWYHFFGMMTYGYVEGGFISGCQERQKQTVFELK